MTQQGWRSAEVCWRLAPDPCSGSGGSTIVLADILNATTQTIGAASDTILVPDASPLFTGPVLTIVHLRNVSGAPITLTSTPNVEDGAYEKQQLLLELEVGSNGVIIQDEAVLAGSNFRLAAGSNKTIGARDSIWFTWVLSDGGGVWLQTGNLVQA